MKISIITDELSSDLDTALELASELGVQGVELRGIGEHRYPDVSRLMQARVPELLSEYQLPVVSLSPGLFKIPLPKHVPENDRVLLWDDAIGYAREQRAAEVLAYHVEELLPRTIEAAADLGCPLINCFSFLRGVESWDAPIPERVIELLRHAAKLAAKSGLILSIENDGSCWGATTGLLAHLLGLVAQPNVGVTWDPANAYRAGQERPFPDGYETIRDSVRHVHLKNAATDSRTGRRYFDFDGAIDWSGQLQALLRDNYTGFVSIETHQRPKLSTTRRYIRLYETGLHRTV
jgi:sugar phosphate isomerase/epimerase